MYSGQSDFKFHKYFSVHCMYCTSLQRRPTAGLPPDVLPLSGVLFSQSLMRPATPVFITAASCLDRVKGQQSLVVIVSGAEQEVPVYWALSSLSLSLSAPVRHTQSFMNFLRASTTPFSFYLECASSTSRRAEHVAFLPHALDASYVVGDQGQIGRSGARGSRLLVLSLLRQSGGFKKRH